MTDPPTHRESEPARTHGDDSAPVSPPAAAGEPQAGHPARKWIVATVVLALAAIGLGAWALALRSDAEDKDAQIAAQQKQLEEQQDLAGRARDAASGFAEDAQQAFRELGAELEQVRGTAAATQEQTQQAIDRAEQAAAEASDRVDDARGEVDQARAQADEAAARAEAAGACARGYVSAIAGVFDAESITDGVAQAKEDVQALSTSCAGSLSP